MRVFIPRFLGALLYLLGLTLVGDEMIVLGQPTRVERLPRYAEG